MSDSVLKSVTFTEPEYNLVFNLLQDHLDEIMEDILKHNIIHDATEGSLCFIFTHTF